MSSVSRLEVIATGSRRRWTLAEKCRIVAESYRAPRIVSATARRHGLTPSQLFTWRRLDSEGRLTADADALTFVPAIVADGCQRALNATQFGACKIPHLAGPAISREFDGQLHVWVVDRAAGAAA
jgi:transposase-like protein